MGPESFNNSIEVSIRQKEVVILVILNANPSAGTPESLQKPQKSCKITVSIHSPTTPSSEPKVAVLPKFRHHLSVSHTAIAQEQDTTFIPTRSGACPERCSFHICYSSLAHGCVLAFALQAIRPMDHFEFEETPSRRLAAGCCVRVDDVARHAHDALDLPCSLGVCFRFGCVDNLQYYKTPNRDGSDRCDGCSPPNRQGPHLAQFELGAFCNA